MKIHLLLRKIYKLRTKVRLENRQALDAHLYGTEFHNIELLLRSTRTLGRETVLPQELETLRDQYTCQEERRIHADLQKITYTIDSSTTVSLVTGQGRIERYIYPLIYLFLKHDLEIVQLACKHDLSTDEFEKVEISLNSVFLAFDARRSDLIATFQQTHGDLERKLENYAFGMFEKSYKFSSLSWSVSESNLESVWERLPPESDDDIDENIAPNILKSGVQQPPDCPKPYQFVNEDCDNEFRTLEGLWAGYCTWEDTDGSMIWYGGLICLSLTKSTGSTTFNGEALCSSWDDPVDLQGCLIDEQGTTCGTKLSLELGWIKCSGTLNETSTKIIGDWLTFFGAHQSCSGTFCFTRTPAPLVQFRYTESESEKDRSRALWKFAAAAVLQEVGRQQFSKVFVITRLRENRRRKELNIKAMIDKAGYTCGSPYKVEEFKELKSLEQTIDPTVSQFFRAIARSIIQRLPYL
ncbi:hypothetical protein C0992_001085 [Termitomyces sp. T32_za158]|nr:hypothetical protein C0992_001085 [Termitomyces sp. T32_za158]